MSTPAEDTLVTVRLELLPVDLQTAAQQHSDELTRELMLVAEGMQQQGEEAVALPKRFVELLSALSSRYSMFTAEQEQQLRAATAAGAPTVDLVYRVPASAGPAAASLGDILDEVDAYCREGRLLLTLETPAPIVTYRRWFLEQFVEQCQGRSAVSWPAYLEDRAAAAPG
jgi:hypothetical protein